MSAQDAIDEIQDYAATAMQEEYCGHCIAETVMAIIERHK